MPQLFTLRGDRLQRIYSIHKKITIGNLPGCDIAIPHIDNEEMPIYVEILEGKSKCILRKIRGMIPLLVNGKEAVGDISLIHRDTIGIAEIVLLFNEATQENIIYDSQATTTDILAILPQEDSETSHLKIFYRLFDLTSNTFDLQILLNRLVDFLLDTFQGTTAMIFLKEAGLAHFRPAACKSCSEKVDWKIIRISFSRKALYLVSRKKQSILCRGQSEKGCSLLMISPLVYQNEVLGIMVVEAKENGQMSTDNLLFSEHDLYIHGGIALLVANSIAHLQNYLERKKHTKRLEILNKVTLKLSSLLDAQSIYRETAKEVVRLLKCTKCSVLYTDSTHLHVGYAVGIPKEKARKIAIPHGEQLSGWVAKNGKPLLSCALPDDLKPTARKKYHSSSFAIVPIFGAEGKSAGATGVICATDRINKSPFRKQDLELLDFISGRVGIALVNASLYEQATVDFLTKVYLRGYFLEKLKEALTFPRKPMSLLMLDIDHFKPLNDRYGHQTGDLVLQRLGELIKENIRENDLPGRYGGEEFLIFLDDSPYPDAFQIAERIRWKVDKCEFNVGSSPVHITVSIGVVQYRLSEKIENFLLRCDKALYQAKNNGRNRVC